MEVLPSNGSYCDDDSKNLQLLLDAFGSVVSLEDIASAYCQAGRDVYTAGELLCNHQGSTSCISSSASKYEFEGAGSSDNLQGSTSCVSSASKDEFEDAGSSDNLLGRSDAERNSIAPKQRKYSASMGTVSGIIGREYGRTRTSNNEPREATKPLKLDSSELAASDIWGEEVPSDGVETSEPIKKDVEEFLFSMLGNGFQLDNNVIQEVLGLCGYDITKSFEKLLDLSALTEKVDDVLSVTAQKPMKKTLELEAPLSLKNNSQCKGSGGSRTGMLTRNESELPNRDPDRYNLQKEVLESLFTVPERVEELPKRIIRPTEARRAGVYGSLVTEPPRDRTTENRKIAKPKVTVDETEENEYSYNGLRKASKEFWITMKGYYESAVDAFTKGDRILADKLMKEGQFFANKAREANDKSAEKLIETSDEEEEVSLDLHDHEPKEAVRSLKCHLTNLSGIHSIPHLKVLVSNDDNDTKGATRKKRILELLERESIKWTEEGSGQIIVIRVDKINPKRLSFA